jgi:hypothetical protein
MRSSSGRAHLAGDVPQRADPPRRTQRAACAAAGVKLSPVGTMTSRPALSAAAAMARASAVEVAIGLLHQHVAPGLEPRDRGPRVGDVRRATQAVEPRLASIRSRSR